ncbi:MAG: hypothetical protein MK116_09940 [Phycisphaerales bacterium]|nr:hypothetical protein [Phycisphaerales bacterium]
MTLKRKSLTAALLALATLSTLGTGCASTQSRSSISSNNVVRYASMDNTRSPLALGAGDSLGAALYMAHDVD